MINPNERHAALRGRVSDWTRRLNVRPRMVRICSMTRKWGSCSTLGIVTLASDLSDQTAGFQDFVIVHELLHLRVPNHGRLFKALMTAHVPVWKSYDLQRRREVPVQKVGNLRNHGK